MARGWWWVMVGSLSWLEPSLATTQERQYEWGWGMYPMWGIWGIGMMLMMLVFWSVVIVGVVLAIRRLVSQGKEPRLNGLLVMAVLVLAPLLAALTVSTQAAGPPLEVHHIHGLAVDQRDPELLYVATHTGLVRLRKGGKPEWVGAQRFDLMGFITHPREPSSTARWPGSWQWPTRSRKTPGPPSSRSSRWDSRSS